MKAKQVVRLVLLFFVIASVTVLAIRELQTKPDAREIGAAEVNDSSIQPDRVAVYYFHRTKRCASCLNIEKLTEKALKNYFAQAAAENRLEWKTFNVDLPEHDHFRADYELKWQHLIVAEFKDSKRVRFKDLPAIWDLNKTPDAFLKYIHTEVGAYLETP